MKLALFLIVACGLILASCTSTGELTPLGVSTLRVACTFDQMAPGAVATVGTIVAIADPTVADQVAQAKQAAQLAHPLVQSACAAIPGTPQPLVVALPGSPVPPPGTPIVLPSQ